MTVAPAPHPTDAPGGGRRERSAPRPRRRLDAYTDQLWPNARAQQTHFATGPQQMDDSYGRGA